MFLGLVAVNLVLSVVAFFVLPERYFFDTKIIIIDRYHEIGLIGSYPFAILFYKITGLKYLPYPIIALIQYPILAYILYKLGIPDDFHVFNVKNVLVYIVFFMMAIFVSMPSKEFITFTFLSTIPFVFQSTKITDRYKIPLTVLLFAFFGSFFRIYYLIVPIIAVGMYMVTLVNFKNKTTTALFYGILISIFISLSYGMVKGENLSQTSRDSVNDARMNSKDANSMIVSPLDTATWYGEAVGITYGFFSVNIPIEGFKHFMSPQIIAFIIWQLLLFYILLIRFAKCLNDRHKNKFLLWNLLFLFSYFIVQGVFEPDLGTATRHKIGVFPLIYYALYYEYFRKKLQQDI